MSGHLLLLTQAGRAADPAYVAPTATAFSGVTAQDATAATTTVTSCAVGDQLVLNRSMEGDGVTSGTWSANPSSTGGASTGQLTWTRRVNILVSGRCQEEVWYSSPLTAAGSVVCTTGTITVGSQRKAITVQRARNAAVIDGNTPAIAVSAPAAGTFPDSTLLSTRLDNSLVAWSVSDFSASAPGTPAYLSGATQQLLDDASGLGAYVGYDAIQDAPIAGPQRIGMTTPAAGQTWSLVAIVIEPLPPTSGFAGTVNLTGSGGLTFGPTTPATGGAVALSGSGALTMAGKPSQAATLALSGTGTLTAGGTPTVSGAVNLTGSGTLTTTGVLVAVGAVALTGTGTLTTTGSAPTAAGALTLSGSGTLTTVAAAPSARGTVTLSGSGTLTTTAAAPAAAGAVTLTGSGSLVMAGKPSTAAVLPLAGTGTLTMGGSPAIPGTVALSGSGTLTAVGSAPAAAGSVALTGTGTLNISTGTSGSGTVNLSGSGTLTTTTVPRPTGAVALSGSGTLTTTGGAPAARGTVALTGAGTLTYAAKPTAPGALDLSGSGQLTTTAGAPSAAGVLALTGSGQLTVTAPQAAAGVLALTGSGILVLTPTPIGPVDVLHLVAYLAPERLHATLAPAYDSATGTQLRYTAHLAPAAYTAHLEVTP